MRCGCRADSASQCCDIFRQYGHDFLQGFRIFLHETGDDCLRIASCLLEFNASCRREKIVENHDVFPVPLCQDAAELYLLLDPFRIPAKRSDAGSIPDRFQVMKLLVRIEEKSIRHDFHEIRMP